MNGKGPRIPTATYRIQFNGGFRFEDAAGIVPYLRRLGVSDIYASPYFKAHPGSLHGYDILDQNTLNPEVGSQADYEALCGALERHGMGQILDIVPNHMCIEGRGNAYWTDVLENGPSSPYSAFFDINWHPVKAELENKILIPILGDQYGTVLENGELRLAFEEGAFFVCYYDHKLPVVPKTYNHILTLGLDALERELGADEPRFQELLSIVTALKHLPRPTERDPERIAERHREKEVVKRRLWNLYQECQPVRGFVDANVALLNGVPGEPRSYDRLDGFLQEQVYRISHWRVATEEINYRRFFDINALGALRVEDPEVLEQTHRLIFSLVESGKVSGLRIDHADGLRDPEDYIRRVQSGCFLRLFGGAGEGDQALQGALTEKLSAVLEADPSYKPFYIIAEKILLKNEKLPESWQVFSTTGYDFVNQVNGLFVDTEHAKTFETLYTRFLGHRIDFHDAVYQKKKLVMQVSMSSEINTLGYYLNRISERNRHTRDFTLNSLITAILEVIACFPVYRTYTNSLEVSERDRQYIEAVIVRAKRQNPAVSASVFDFLKNVLLLRFPESMAREDQPAWFDFVQRFQQITGPVMAKGVEDTAFYLYNRLVSLNEVGGSPERFGITLEAFHGQNIERGKNRPLAMLASSTHDTKRSEDVRARINVLSEIPGKWRDGLSRWSRQNRRLKMMVDGKSAPSRNEEYLLYQTLVGTWPICDPGTEEFALFRSRIRQYMLKAMREAKVHTSWISPNTLREDAVFYFIDAILSPGERNAFLPDFAAFQTLTAQCGIFNSLSQTLLKIASPGIPDFYQGNELWDFSLVDPDNRRPVDYEARVALLEELAGREAACGLLETARQLVASRSDGRIKMFLTWKALNLRRERRELFESGRYLPLAVQGACREHVCAFERSVNDASVLVVVPRFCSRLLPEQGGLPLGPKVWGDTRVLQPFDPPLSRYRNVFTGEILQLSHGEEGQGLGLQEILAEFPAALLERVAGG